MTRSGIKDVFYFADRMRMAAIKYINSKGYVVLSDSNELEHRFIAKRILGRELKETEIVHHINGKKDDNETRNLCVMGIEEHEQFHVWLQWKEKKTGSRPSMYHQKKMLEKYGGILLETLALEKFVVRRNKVTNKFFIEFDEEILISPEGRDIEIDQERFGEPEETLESNLTEKQLQVYQNKIKCRDSEIIEEHKKLEGQKILFNELKKERKRLAEQAGMPAYIVFDDMTLTEMSEIMPSSESELLQIKGVGRVKLQWYGSFFIGIIKKFKKDFNIS